MRNRLRKLASQIPGVVVGACLALFLLLCQRVATEGATAMTWVAMGVLVAIASVLGAWYIHRHVD